jgi:DNA-directed RNA polymerase specialized sigma24 family protein
LTDEEDTSMDAPTGDLTFARRLYRAHADALYGVLRLTLGASRVAEQALVETFTSAALRADEVPVPVEGPGARAWMLDLALRTIESEHAGQVAGPAPAASRSATLHPPLANRGVLEQTSDATLGVLIRTLPQPARQALALGVVCGIPQARVARILDLPLERVVELQEQALVELNGQLAAHDHVPARRTDLSAKPLPRLVPLPTNNGSVVIRGTRAFLQTEERRGLLELALQVLDRFLERFRRRHQHDPNDDTAGTPRRGPAELPPTPTTQPFERPQPTPSMRPHRTPKATAGMASYATPKSTPSTERLSSRPRNALAAGGGTFGSSGGGLARRR